MNSENRRRECISYDEENGILTFCNIAFTHRYAIVDFIKCIKWVMDMSGEKYYFKFDEDEDEAVMSENLYQVCVHLAHKAEEFNKKWSEKG